MRYGPKALSTVTNVGCLLSRLVPNVAFMRYFVVCVTSVFRGSSISTMCMLAIFVFPSSSDSFLSHYVFFVKHLLLEDIGSLLPD